MENQPAKQRMIKDIKEDDQKVQITGRIDTKEDENSFILEDGTGKMRVHIEKVDFPYKKGDLVNVYGVLGYGEDNERILNALIIQNRNGLNFKYYKELYEIKKKYL